MHPRAFIALLLIVLSMYVLPASASEVMMGFEQGNARINLVLSLHQNVTTFPNQAVSLNDAQALEATSAITDAMRKTNAGATLSDFTMNLKSSGSWLNLTATMVVSGISRRQGDVSTFNATWKAYNVSADMQASDFSYNTVGIRYLRPVIAFYANASRLAGRPNSTIQGLDFVVNETEAVSGETAANHVGNFTIFDFRGLQTPLELWTRTYNFQNNTTTWRHAPITPLDMSMKLQLLNGTFRRVSDFSYTAQIVVPGVARAQGNVVFVDVGTGQKELIMAGVLVVALAIAIASQLLYGARKKTLKFKRR